MTTKSPIKGKTISEQKTLDKQSQAMLFEGASLSQLSQMFSQDIRKVKSKLHGLLPTNTRASHPIYKIAEAARYLVKPMWDIDEWISRLDSAKDLPTELSKEYWAGKRSRQLFEEHAGDLWRTEKVIDMVTDLFKGMAMSLRLVDDAVNSESILTSKQREVIRRLMDEALSNTHDELLKILEESKNRGGIVIGRSSEDQLDEDDEI